MRDPVEAEALVNGEVVPKGACGLARQTSENLGTTLGKSAINAQTANLCGLWDAQIEVFPAGFRATRLPTADEIEHRHAMRNREPWGGKRGKVGGMSKRASNRCIVAYTEIGREDHPLMVTLTYRLEVKWDTSKNHLHRFSQWLVRNFDACGIWRLEVQVRGVIHYHVLVWGIGQDGRQFEEIQDQLRRKWCELTGQGMDEHRMREGCHIRACGNDSAARRYLGCHSIKKDQQAYYKGRHWGMFNRSELELGKASGKETLTRKQWLRWNRTLRALVASHNGGRRFDFNRKTQYVHSMDRYRVRKLIDWIKTNW